MAQESASKAFEEVELCAAVCSCGCCQSMNVLVIPAASFAGLFDFCWVETVMLVLLQTFMLIDNDVAA